MRLTRTRRNCGSPLYCPLLEAALLGDPTIVQESVTEIVQMDPVFGTALSYMVRDFDFDRLVQIARRSGTDG